jgi:excinuclease ABC subunit C
LKDNGIMPDLIIVDGGKAQVNAANGILEKLGLNQIKVVGLKKGKIHSQISDIVFKEQIFSEEVKEIQLKKNTAGYNVLQNVSSEYHRRAIQHHRKRLEKRILSSEIDDVPGIGSKTKVKLLDHFKTVENVKKAKMGELKNILGQKKGVKIFNSLHDFFKNKKSAALTELPKKIINIRKLAKK